MARRLNLSRSSNDDGVAWHMGRAIVLPRGLVENTVTFDRPSQLPCPAAGWKLLHGWKMADNLATGFHSPGSSVCSGAFASHENVMSGRLDC
jgi:hypothetical protein